HETGVVDELTVEGQDPSEQALPVHPRQESKGLSSVERAGAGKHVVGGAHGPAQQVADTRPAAYEQRAKCARVPVDRDDHGQRPYQVRCGDPHEQVTFTGALVGDVELPLGQVAQPAVDEFGAPSAGTEGQVVPFHQHRGQAAGGGVQGSSRAGDPGSDHQDVHPWIVLQCGEGGGTPTCVQGRGRGDGGGHGESFPGGGVRDGVVGHSGVAWGEVAVEEYGEFTDEFFFVEHVRVQAPGGDGALHGDQYDAGQCLGRTG